MENMNEIEEQTLEMLEGLFNDHFGTVPDNGVLEDFACTISAAQQNVTVAIVTSFLQEQGIDEIAANDESILEFVNDLNDKLTFLDSEV